MCQICSGQDTNILKHEMCTQDTKFYCYLSFEAIIRLFGLIFKIRKKWSILPFYVVDLTLEGPNCEFMREKNP